MKKQIINVKAVLPDGVREDCSVLFEDGIIVGAGNIRAPEAQTVDGHGMLLMPGFIDIHCHGGAGFDFMDASPDEMSEIARFHLSHGTTTLVPTTMTDGWDAIGRALDRLGEFYGRNEDSVLLGAHLEGPWLSPKQCGAQSPENMDEPSVSKLEEIVRNYPFVSRISAAPELKCGMEIGAAGQKKGLVMSMAHTDADFDTAIAASESGYSLMTHLYSGMSGVARKNAYRIAGAVEAGLYSDDLTVEMIADGKHLPLSLLKFVFKCKGPERICLVTDAMRACGLPEGALSVLGRKDGGVPVIVEDGVAKMTDKQSFAGSVATTDRLVRTMCSAGIDVVAVSRMASSTPASVMRLRDRGSIEAGKRADFVLLDDRLRVRAVIRKGKTEFQTGEDL